MTKHQFIIDQEIDLFEKQGDGDVQKVDLLNTSTYVNTLTDCVMSAPKDKPFTIGLFGEWGSGKSSIIKTFSKDIVEKYVKEYNQKVKVITYDAWKYSNDSFRRMFLLQMQKELGYKREHLMNSFYLNSSEDAHIDTRFDWKTFLIGALVVLVAVIGIVKFTDFTTDGKILATAIVSFCSLAFTIIRGLFREVKVNIQKPHMFAPEQFEACYDEMTDMALGVKRDVWDYIKPVKGVTGLHRLIIVIDNVDRCTTELALELLTNIKNFLGQKHNTVFIIPVDEEALKKHIVNNKPSAIRESDEFLRKFFNICIRIKPFQEVEMYSFAAGINERNNLGLHRTTVSLVANEFASNPRRIIQIFNNLQVELSSLPDEISENHQALVCKLLIIREEYPDFYKKLLQDSKALFRLEELEDKKDKNGNVIEKATPQMQAALRFLKATTAVTSDYENNLPIIDRILTNSNVLEKLPKDIIKEYNDMQFGEVTIAYAKDTTNRLDLLNYVLNKLEIAIKRGLWETDVKNSFDRLVALNKIIPYSYDENLRAVRIVDNNNNFSKIAEKQDNSEEIILYAASAEKQGVKQFANWLSLYVINSNNTEIHDLDSICLACKELSPKQVKTLDKVILKACQKNMMKICDYDFGNNSSYVYSDAVFDYIISQLPTENAHAFECIVQIASRIQLKKEWLKKALSALTDLIPEYDYSNNTNFDEEKGVLESATQLLSLSHHIHLEQSDKAELDGFTEAISKFALDPRSNQVGFVLNNLDNSEFVDSLIDFIHEYIIITKSSYRFPETIKTISSENPENEKKVIDLINGLFDENYPIESYSTTILESNAYTSGHIRLLDFILKFKNKANKYLANESEVTTHYKALLKKARNVEDADKVQYEKAILSIAKDERNEQILRKIIQEMNSKELLDLPDSLLNYAIKAFENHFDDYKSNYKILSILFEKGKKDIKKKILALLSYNLVTNKSLDSDLQLIMALTGLTDKDKESLKDNLELAAKEKPNYAEKIDKCLEFLGYTKEPEKENVDND
jgi:hypothetical protein